MKKSANYAVIAVFAFCGNMMMGAESLSKEDITKIAENILPKDATAEQKEGMIKVLQANPDQAAAISKALTSAKESEDAIMAKRAEDQKVYNALKEKQAKQQAELLELKKKDEEIKKAQEPKSEK